MNSVPPSSNSEKEVSPEATKYREIYTPERIVEIFSSSSFTSADFSEAFKQVEQSAFTTENLLPFHNTYQEVTEKINRNILSYLDTETDLSRAHFSQQTRDFIAFRAWLMGSPDGKLLTKDENGVYAFETLLDTLFQDWHTSTLDNRETMILKMRRVFSLLINFIETKLPDRFVKEEVHEIYTAILSKIDTLDQSYFTASRHEIGMVAAQIIRNNFKNNYQAYLNPWTSESQAQQNDTCEALIALQRTYLDLISSPLNKKARAEENNKKMERFATLQRMTCEFRYSTSVLRSKNAPPEVQLEAIKSMVGIFHEVYGKRMNWWNIARGEAELFAEMDENNAAQKIETFRNHLIGYNPHKFNFQPTTYSENKTPTTGRIIELPVVTANEKTIDIIQAESVRKYKEASGILDDHRPIPAANQAELNIVSDLLELLPQGFTSEWHLIVLLKNLLGNTQQEFDYPQMDNHQAYILRMIEEILTRLESTDEEFLKENMDQFSNLARYLDGVPHHPIHLGLVGNINIRLANLYALTHKHSPIYIGSKAEEFFVKWLKLHNTESIDNEKGASIVEMGSIFLRSYLETWKNKHKRIVLKSNEEVYGKDPLWDVKFAFDLILDSAEFVNYDSAIKTQVNDDIYQIVRDFRAAGKLEHHCVHNFLNEIAGVIFRAYDGMFNVSIREKGFFGGKLGDSLQSDFIDIGFGYFMCIEYPIESKAMIERGLTLEKDGETIHHGELHKIVTEIAVSQLAYFIQQATPPEHIGKLIPTEKFKKMESKASNDLHYVDVNKYAALRRLILSEEGGLEITVMHQKKYYHGEAIGSELLVRFGHNDIKFSTAEVFAFLDVFGIYSEFSKKILQLHFQAAKKLGTPVSMNIRGDQFAQKDFIDFIREQITLSGVDPDMLTFEILETQALDLTIEGDYVSPTIESMRALKNLGIHFAVDDFGAGSNNGPFVSKLETLNLIWCGDEIKFDVVYKQNLEELNAIMTNWQWAEITNEAQLRQAIAASKTISNNTNTFFESIASWITKGRKCTIEQIEPNETHLLKLINILGLIVQGYCYHKPEKIDLKPTKPKTTADVRNLTVVQAATTLKTPGAAA